MYDFLAVYTISYTILELFDFQEYRDLKGSVRGHSRSMEMAAFDRLLTSSHSSSAVTMVISCILSEISWVQYAVG